MRIIQNKYYSAQEYFNQCKAYWINNGDSEDDAGYKALWWDCKEVWDFDNLWNAEKREFFREMIALYPERESEGA